MTFSIVARCRASGQFGAAVCSSSPAVAARCIRARAGVGAVASQNITDPALGAQMLALMQTGASASEALNRLVASAPHIEFRQLMAVDERGTSAIYTGSAALGVVGSAQGADAACAGNLLAHRDVPQAMLDAFHAGEGEGEGVSDDGNGNGNGNGNDGFDDHDAHDGGSVLADRLLRAMQAGLAAGGEASPVHSAGLLIVDRVAWPVVDLRIDWTEGDPIAELAALWALYRPQMHSYTRRALDPSSAPSYGVAGDP